MEADAPLHIPHVVPEERLQGVGRRRFAAVYFESPGNGICDDARSEKLSHFQLRYSALSYGRGWRAAQKVRVHVHGERRRICRRRRSRIRKRTFRRWKFGSENGGEICEVQV